MHIIIYNITYQYIKITSRYIKSVLYTDAHVHTQTDFFVKSFTYVGNVSFIYFVLQLKLEWNPSTLMDLPW